MKKFMIFWAALLLLLFGMLLWPEQASGDEALTFSKVPVQYLSALKRGLCMTKKDGSFTCINQIEESIGLITLAGAFLYKGSLIIYTAQIEVKDGYKQLNDCKEAISYKFVDGKKYPHYDSCDRKQVYAAGRVFDGFVSQFASQGIKGLRCTADCENVFPK